MVCSGGPWRVRCYAVEDALEGFAAGVHMPRHFVGNDTNVQLPKG